MTDRSAGFNCVWSGWEEKEVREGIGDQSDEGLESCGVWDLSFRQQNSLKISQQGRDMGPSTVQEGERAVRLRDGRKESGRLRQWGATPGGKPQRQLLPDLPRTCGRVVSHGGRFSATSALEGRSLLEQLKKNFLTFVIF